MAVATTVPIVWGLATGHEQGAEWIAVTADCICWVSLKGDFAQRLRVLAGGIVLALIFGILGSLSGGSFALSMVLMLGVAFLSGLFKNLGDRGSGLAFSVYVLFLITNAHGATGKALEERAFWILVGGVWNALLTIAAFFFASQQQPYRRNIALIWKAAGRLAAAVGRGWDGKALRSTTRDIYLSEKTVRETINSSFVFYERMAHQVHRSKADRQEYHLAQLRKSASLVAAHISAIHDESDGLSIRGMDEVLRRCLHEVMIALESTAVRASVLVLTLRPEEGLLMQNRLEHLRSTIVTLQDYKAALPISAARAVRRIAQLATRAERLLTHAASLLEHMEEQPEYRSYSLVKTALVLHPKHWWRSIRLLFNYDSHTFRYVLRSTLAATLAFGIYKWIGISHGYWLPFTVMTVMQPYFGATLRKAGERIIGTLAGGLAGGLLLRLPAGLHLREIMMFGSAIAMVYFLRRRYSVAAFFITLNLVLLFSVSEELNRNLIITRAATTLAGAAIAVIAGFALLPAWDKKYLPRHIRAAIRSNWEYFSKTVLAAPDAGMPWTRCRRAAETANSNAFDSFNRFMQEYHRNSKDSYRNYYNLITRSIRVTRELNNLHLELESADRDALQVPPSPRIQYLLEECTQWFEKIMTRIEEPAAIQGKIATAPYNEIYLERLLTELSALHESLIGLPPAGE